MTTTDRGIRTLPAPRAWTVATALLPFAVVLVTGVQCSFSPDLNGGVLKCGPADSCPDDYVCKQTFCCAAAGDPHLECGGPDPTPDAAAPADTADLADGAAAVIGTPRRLVPGLYDLVSSDTSCTRANPATTADRWCAFSRASELWILNVTQAAKDPIPCNGTNPGCLRLTATLFGTDNDNLSYTRPAFSGDLLIYYADAAIDPAAPNDYRGGIFAWYPGWTGPRALTTASGGRCFANDRGGSAAAWCSDRAADGTVDVRAGLVPADQPLPVLMKLGSNHILAGFNRSADRLVFAFGPPADPAWPLYLVPTSATSDPSKQVMLAPKTKSWALSADGTLVYLIKEEGQPKGPVLSVDTATGMQQTQIAPAVEKVSSLSDDLDMDLGFATLDDGAGDVSTTNLYLDRTAPTKAVAVGRVAGLLLSPDGHTSFTWKLLDKGRRDASLFDNQTGATCVLQTEARTVNLVPTFSPDGHFIYWIDVGPTYRDGTGWVTVAPSCTARRMFTAGPIFYYYPVNNRGVIYLDAPDGPVNLRYLTLNRDTAEPSAPVTLDTKVTHVTVIDPDRKLAVYATADPGREGIYIVDLP